MNLTDGPQIKNTLLKNTLSLKTGSLKESNQLRAEERAFNIKHYSLQLAEQARVEVRFLKPRRSSDITVLSLYGERARVLALPVLFEDAFRTESIEIMHARRNERHYVLTLAITQKLSRQVSTYDEQRQKLFNTKLLNDKPSFSPNYVVASAKSLADGFLDSSPKT